MDKHLILVRHSTPEIDRSIPSSQWVLNDTGKIRGHQLARQLSSYPVGMVVSSSEPKALGTARIIASYHQLTPLVNHQLNEHERSRSALLSESDFRKAMIDLFRYPTELVFGSETADEASTRFEEVIQRFLLDDPGEDMVIVSHGTVMALFIARQLNEKPYRIWRDMPMPIAYVFSQPELRLLSIIQVEKDEK